MSVSLVPQSKSARTDCCPVLSPGTVTLDWCNIVCKLCARRAVSRVPAGLLARRSVRLFSVVSRSVSSNTRSLSRHVVALHCTRSSWYAVQVSTLGPTTPLRRAPSCTAAASRTGRRATASWSRATSTPKVSSKLFSVGSLRRRPARPHLHLHPTHRRPCQEYLEDLDILRRPRQEYLEDLDIPHSRSSCRTPPS